MGQILSEPKTNKMTTCIQNDYYHVGSSAMQGWRLTMEDHHLQILDIPEDPGTSYFAVFDGHGGASVAKYAGRNLLKCLLRRTEYSTNMEHALKKAFLDLDAELLMNMAADEIGSTAIVVIIKDNLLYCANLGDSRAVACIGGKLEALSKDHKPNNDMEKNRITEAGGWVHSNRVNGNLALSRALGDFSFKRNPRKRVEEQIVIASPDVVTRALNENWEFIVLACDGIWDVMESEDVVNFCRQRIGRGMPIERICEELLDYCISPTVPVTGNGGDNMTVIIVCFLHGKAYERLVQRCAPKDNQVVGDGNTSTAFGFEHNSNNNLNATSSLQRNMNDNFNRI